jgi:hypothetical protein
VPKSFSWSLDPKSFLYFRHTKLAINITLGHHQFFSKSFSILQKQQLWKRMNRTASKKSCSSLMSELRAGIKDFQNPTILFGTNQWRGNIAVICSLLGK